VETVTLGRDDLLVTIEIGYYELKVLDKETEEDLDARAVIVHTYTDF